MSKKRYIYKVYNSSNVLINVWSKEVISLPSFTTEINGSAGQLMVDLARPFENFGEGDDVAIGNRVDVIIYDNEEPSGGVLYRGLISSYQPVLDKGNEIVAIILLPQFVQAGRYMLEDGSNTTITYTSEDPGDIFADILDKFYAAGATFVPTGYSLWDVSLWDVMRWGPLLPIDIDRTGTSVTYTFNTNTVKEAIDKALELCPENWYYRVDPDGTIALKEKSSVVTHDLSIGIHFESLVSQKRDENIINTIYFVGGGDPAFFKKYERDGSITAFGQFSKKIVDQRVTLEATADTMAAKILDENELPETRLKLVIPDNNGNDTEKGYDIESIKVGQTLRIKNIETGVQDSSLWDVMLWDVGSWDYDLTSTTAGGLLITKTKYSANSIEVETSTRFPVVAKRIEDINRNLEQTQVVNNPSAPTN